MPRSNATARKVQHMSGAATSLAIREDMLEAIPRILGHYHPKTLANWTGATPRAANNWLNAACAPSAEHLCALARECPELREHAARWLGIEEMLRGHA